MGYTLHFKWSIIILPHQCRWLCVAFISFLYILLYLAFDKIGCWVSIFSILIPSVCWVVCPLSASPVLVIRGALYLDAIGERTLIQCILFYLWWEFYFTFIRSLSEKIVFYFYCLKDSCFEVMLIIVFHVVLYACIQVRFFWMRTFSGWWSRSTKGGELQFQDSTIACEDHLFVFSLGDHSTLQSTVVLPVW